MLFLALLGGIVYAIQFREKYLKRCKLNYLIYTYPIFHALILTALLILNSVVNVII